jgi:hypothetical protein
MQKTMQNKTWLHSPFSSLQRRLIAVVAVMLTAVLSASYDTDSANAQVVSAKARYDRGILIVRGKTAEPRQFVSLDRVNILRSNRVGRFVFRQMRLPRVCTVRLQSAGHETRCRLGTARSASLSKRGGYKDLSIESEDKRLGDMKLKEISVVPHSRP